MPTGRRQLPRSLVPHQPERFFRTLRQSLLEHLPGYKGPDVASRGQNVEAEAFYYVGELEQLIREWVGRVYHHTAHAGLVDPLERRAALSPTEMFARGVAAAGRMRLPANADLVYDFLEVEWRTIQHYGVEIDGQRYDGPGVNDYRGVRSLFAGAHPGKWPFLVDRDDIRAVFFRDPVTATLVAVGVGARRRDRRPVLLRRRPLRPQPRRKIRPARRPAAGGAGPAHRLGQG